MNSLFLIILSGLIAILYGYIAGKQVLSANPGNSKMQEIASAIQIGAKAYLNRQYKTIAIVGLFVLVIVTYFLGIWVGLGYFIGAFLSAVAGYVGMLVSVQANVRTAEASRKGLSEGLAISFKSGAVTGMLVAGLALLSIAIYYLLLLTLNVDAREIIAPGDVLHAEGIGVFGKLVSALEAASFEWENKSARVNEYHAEKLERIKNGDLSDFKPRTKDRKKVDYPFWLDLIEQEDHSKN